MKTNYLRTLAAALAAGVILTCSVASAQMTDNAQPAATLSTAPPLAYGVDSVLQLARANVSDDTIISYIKNSGNSYGLNADQIIYLRQQGVSSAVINAMLNQPKPGVLAATTTTSATQPVAAYADTAAPATTTVAPTVTYVQTVPATTYYYQPYYYPAYGGYYGGYYNGYYGWPYPAVSLSFGWGGHWGGGWHGGWGGGWHGGWHGGGGGGWHGGGWHR